MPAEVSSPWLQYARRVVAGEVLACRLIVLACERFLRDLDREEAETEEFPYRFDEDLAARVVGFFGKLRHSKGKWRGKALRLEPWQQFIEANLFGWVHRETGHRRFSRAYEEIPRKNGKSTRLSGRGLYLFFADGEGAPEVYAAATSKDQAKIVFNEAKRMVEACRGLAARVTVYQNALSIPNRDATFQPLTKESEKLQGLNVHGAIIDEYHVHPTDELFEVLRTASGARDQPLLSIITTAGARTDSVCYDERTYAVKILEGVVENDAYFAYIAAAEPTDPWEEESTWIKCNPNWGVSVIPDRLRKEFREAQDSPSKQSGFKRYYLNIWSQQKTAWLNMQRWERCSAGPIDPDDFAGCECWGGLDLARTKDMSSLAWVFRVEDRFAVLWRFWLPEAEIEERIRRDRIHFDAWARDGWLTSTPGDVTDYREIEASIVQDAERFKVRELAYDPHFATDLAQRLQDDHGVQMVNVRQNPQMLNLPSQEFERLVISGKLDHGNNPVATWQAGNVVKLESKFSGLIRPGKLSEAASIDGIVAVIMALGRAVPAQDDQPSVYAERGLLFLGE